MNEQERAVMQQALEALKKTIVLHDPMRVSAITALETALSKQRQKPDSMKEVYARLRERAMRSRM